MQYLLNTWWSVCHVNLFSHLLFQAEISTLKFHIRATATPTDGGRDPGSTQRVGRSHRELPVHLPRPHTPDYNLALSRSSHRLVIIQDGGAVRTCIQSQHLWLHLLVALLAQVEDDVVCVSVVGVLESGDHVAVVLAQLQEADVVRESDGALC